MMLGRDDDDERQDLRPSPLILFSFFSVLMHRECVRECQREVTGEFVSESESKRKNEQERACLICGSWGFF